MKRILVALVALLSIQACGPKGQQEPTAFSGIVSDAGLEILADSPELATRSGLSAEHAGGWYGDRLDARDAESVDLRRGAALRRYAQLRGLDRSTLSDEEKVTYDILEGHLAGAAAGARFDFGRFSELDGFSPYVLTQLDGAYLSLPGFFARDIPVRSFADAEYYLKRLDQVDDALDNETRRARADARAGVIPPDFVIDSAVALAAKLETTPSADSPYVTGLRRRLEAIVGPLPAIPGAAETEPQTKARALLDRATAIYLRDIVPAYRRTRAVLLEMRPRAGAEPGVWRLPDGEAYYRAALLAQTSTTLGPNEIHAMGLARVRSLSSQADMMLRSQGLADGSVGQRLALLTADPRYRYDDSEEGRAAALADVQARISGVEARMPRWIRPGKTPPLDVRPAPDYAALSFTGGYYRSPPIEGAAPGAFVINLVGGGLNKIDLPTLVYHEAMPGHHLQVSRALARRDRPLLRRLIAFNAYSEGWALYAEQLADEMGLYDGDPIGRLGYLRWQLWRAARLVADTGIHAQHWSKAEAVAYLAEVTGDSPALIEKEVERYAAAPGQACGYEIGRMEIVRLRDKARSALGADFDIRDFHDVVLADGDLPLPMLEARVDAWIERAQAAGGGKHAAR